MAEARLDARRAGMLAAMGVEVYRLRARSQSAPLASAEARSVDALPATNETLHVLIVCAHGQRREPRLAQLYAQLPRALRTDAAAIDWCEAAPDGTLAPPPDAPTYLVFGSTMARALGVHLSTAQQQASVIAVAAESAQLPGGAIDKRAFWQVLKPIARVLRGHV